VGNDIVDLQEALAAKKSQDQRFLNRVFTSTEQDLIFDSEQSEITLWLFWAAKETIYKLVSQLESPPVFSHKKSIVRFTNSELSVRYENYNFALSYKITQDYIHVLCGPDAVARMQVARMQRSGIREDSSRIPASPDSASLHPGYIKNFSQQERESIQSAASLAVRYDLKQYLAKKLNLPYSSIEIIRNAIRGKSQPPYLLLNQQKCSIGVSLSHHGRYYAWVLSNSCLLNSEGIKAS